MEQSDYYKRLYGPPAGPCIHGERSCAQERADAQAWLARAAAAQPEWRQAYEAAAAALAQGDHEGMAT
jgi:hypothetical protein